MSTAHIAPPGQEAAADANEVPQAGVHFALASRLIASCRRFARLPRKKLIVLALMVTGVLLVLAGIGAVAVSMIKSSDIRPPAPPPPPVAPPEDVARPPARPTIEERFEAIKRGDLSGIPRRHTEPVRPSLPPIPMPVAPGPSPAPLEGPAATTEKGKPTGDEPGRVNAIASPIQPTPPTPAAETRSPAKSAPSSPLTREGGCEVGAADARRSAASILDCVRYFNELEGGGRPPPTPKK